MSVQAQDQGENFGTWDTPVARFMYEESTPEWVAGLQVDTGRHTIDLGGANGLLRSQFTHLTTVDTDPSKAPDVLADATTYAPPDPGPYQVVARYLLHYMDDQQVRELLAQAATYADTITIVQFTNDDPEAKSANSRHEPERWWRTTPDHLSLLAQGREYGWTMSPIMWTRAYEVTPEFYRHRLGPGEYYAHEERLIATTLTQTPTPSTAISW